MSDLSDYEVNAELANTNAKRQLRVKPREPTKTRAKPVQPTKKAKPAKDVAPVRQSARLRRQVADPTESPAKRRQHEKEEEERRAKEAEERLEAEERAREAKKPRHWDLDLPTLTDELGYEELGTLRTTLQVTLKTAHPREAAAQDSFVFEEDEKENAAVAELKETLSHLKVVARAKVTQDRVYSAAFHPEPTKDLIFFGDKHGQLGIWDARAPAEEAADDEEDTTALSRSDRENGKYWRLQLHWPATSKSSISSIKFDPTDAHSVYTSSYDSTIRHLSFTSGQSSEVFATEGDLISCIDLSPTGNEMWISDASGGLTHLDLRVDRSHAKWYQLSDQKIGSVSINPSNPHFLVTASNNRAMRIWDTRKLADIPIKTPQDFKNDLNEVDHDAIADFVSSPEGKSCLRAEWRHNKSVSAAYWDPRGRSIVSTSYDDTLRLWDFDGTLMKRDATFPSARPMTQIKHDCQTGRWLTVFRAQWSPNPDVYPHFTASRPAIFICSGTNMWSRLATWDTRLICIRRKVTFSLDSPIAAVTCSHPKVVARAASGNASGRCVLWAPSDE
ncbi:predicted protein [Postia placenta Mad-698-R]|nr:predicted protein [Postia placenta Mad-698-R]